MKLVSAIMPTRGRRLWAHQALRCFLAQTYPHKQLVILDEPNDSSFHMPVDDIEDVMYFRNVGQDSIPEKRNLCAELATGDIIMHFDSDDWSDPNRMAEQVKRLEESGLSMTAYHSMLFYVEQTGQAYKYVNDRSYAIGTSFCYLKSFWTRFPFRPDPNSLPHCGEDTLLASAARNTGELISVDAGQLMVARIHDDSTSPHDLSGAQTSYRPVPIEAIPRGFFA